MGARMYDAKIGRFLSVDPLFEKFRNQSPYNYAFNCPLTKSDPSGLAPKGEKNKDRLLEMQKINLMEFCQISDEAEAAMVDAMNELAVIWDYVDFMDNTKHNIYDYYRARMGFGGGGGGSTGTGGDNGGQGAGAGSSDDGPKGGATAPDVKKPLTSDQMKEIMANIHVNCNSSDIEAKFWNKFWSANYAMTDEDYQFYTSKPFEVNILDENQFTILSTDAEHKGTGGEAGWGGLHGDHYEIDYLENMFTHDNYFSGPGGYREYQGPKLDLQSAMLHEFGHCFGAWSDPDYGTLPKSDMENAAIWFTNTRWRIPNGDIPQTYYWDGPYQYHFPPK